MVTILADKREQVGKGLIQLRKNGKTPAVLYGPKTKTAALLVDGKELERVYREAGESTLIDLDFEGTKIPVLIHEVQRHPVSDKIIHVDFYQPPLDKKVEISVPLVFEGEAPAVKEMGGTLLRNIQEIEVLVLPQNLPHEITVSVEGLKTFEDRILVKDLIYGAEVEIHREADDVVAQVVPAEDVEKELAEPVGEEMPVEEAKEEQKQEDKEGDKAKEKKEESKKEK